jgi:hypothetical protein
MRVLLRWCGEPLDFVAAAHLHHYHLANGSIIHREPIG